MAAPGARAGGYGPRHFHLREQRVVKATDIRRGHVVLIDDQPCRVMEFTHRTPGNLRAFVQLRLRNLVTGNTFDTRVSATDFLDEVETSPVMRSATKTASTKPAKLSNGVTVQVPDFISEGQRVRVDPREGKYLERAK